jgi:hypothetical protein
LACGDAVVELGGGEAVGDELEATHQRVSPAKYLAAQRRISRSVVELGLLDLELSDAGAEPSQLGLG